MRVVKDGAVLAQPLVDLDEDSRLERGLLGLTLDPASRPALRLRLLHARRAGGQPPQPLHGQRGEPGRRRPGLRDGAARQHPLVPLPQRGRHPLRPRRQALRRRGRRLGAEQCAVARVAVGEAAADRPRRRDPRRQPVLRQRRGRVPVDLGARAAQPLHLRHRGRDRPPVHQRRRSGHDRGDRCGRDRRAELRLAHDRGPDHQPGLPEPVPLLPARPGVRGHRRRVLRPGDRELPRRRRRRLLLRRLLRGLDQAHRRHHEAGLDRDRRRRRARAGRPEGRRGRQPLLPAAGRRRERAAPARSLRRPRRGAQLPRPAARHDRDRGRAGDLRGERERDGAAALPVAARRRGHPGRDLRHVHAAARGAR